jgi:hypothetical protein
MIEPTKQAEPRRTCPWSGAPSDVCPPFRQTPHASESDLSDHVSWHIREEVRQGDIIDNNDGTFSLPKEA